MEEDEAAAAAAALKAKEKEAEPRPRPLHKTCSLFMRNIAPNISQAEIVSVRPGGGGGRNLPHGCPLLESPNLGQMRGQCL